MTYVIGEALAELRKLPDGFAHTCVCSPPYWGLRDYGTGRWEGGDPTCEHRGWSAGGTERSGLGKFNNGMTREHVEATVARAPALARHECEHCGARRVDQQIGLEETPEEFVEKLTAVFRELRRVLREDGTLWLNLGDSYSVSGRGGTTGGNSTLNGGRNSQEQAKAVLDRMGSRRGNLPPKNLVGMPWRVAFALQADGWILRSDVIWHKPNPLPESVLDRPVKSHEHVFLLAKSERYYYDADAVREPHQDHAGGPERFGNKGQRAEGHKADPAGRARRRMVCDVAPAEGYNPRGRLRRDVWSVPVGQFDGAHFATFPPKLIEPCILAGAPLGGLVIDPFLGSGTVGEGAEVLGRRWFGIELNPEYEPLIRARTSQTGLLFDRAVAGR